MASNLRVDSIVPATGTNVAIGTAGGGVNIPGVLTYEDVTNVDSVGVITARSGIRIGATGANTLISGTATGIGIGEDSPDSLLHIGKGTNADDGAVALTIGGSSVNTRQSTITKNNVGSNDRALEIRAATGGSDETIKFFSDATTERLRIGSSGQIGIGGANYGTSGQFLQSQGASSAVQWASVSSDMQFASWRVDTNWSGVTDPVQNFNPENNNVTMGYSSGIFSFPSTGYWHIMFQTFCYSNSDQDNIELHLMTTTNNSSYTTLSQAYGHMNNDDGGNLYTTIQVNHIFDVTDVSTHKVKFKTAGTSATFHTSAHRDESYAIFKRLAAT